MLDVENRFDVSGVSAVDYYYLHDHLYSAVVLLDSSGTVAEWT